MLKSALFLFQDEGLCYTSCTPLCDGNSSVTHPVQHQDPLFYCPQRNFFHRLPSRLNIQSSTGEINETSHAHKSTRSRIGDKNTNGKKNEKQNSQIIDIKALNLYILQSDFISFKRFSIAFVATCKGKDK